MKITLFCMVVVAAIGFSPVDAALWQDVGVYRADSSVTGARKPVLGRQLIADETALRDLLDSVSEIHPTVLPLPMPDGSLREFRVWRAPVMAPELAAKFPSITSFRLVAVDDPHTRGRLSLDPQGLHVYIGGVDDDTVLIEAQPGFDTVRYRSYSYRSYARHFVSRRAAYRCGVRSQPMPDSTLAASRLARPASSSLAKTEGGYRVYRLAVATTYEYTRAVGGTLIAAMSEINKAVTSVNAIFERDLGIQLVLVANNDLLVSTSVNDGYSNDNPDRLLDENQSRIDSIIGSANYDIGHVLNTGGGGLAILRAACDNRVKAQGESGSSTPTVDAFYIDLLAHELGHQLGANHTFNGTSGACGANRNAATAFEPGSGISIMSYAGICDAENLGDSSIAAFHAGSIEEIVDYTRNGAGNCGSIGSNAGNSAPVVDAGIDVIIPGGTPFELSGSATDLDGDALAYSWEQMDAGSATNANSHGKDLGNNALFRPFAPENTATRVFPRLSSLLANQTDKAETLPTQSRTMNFRLAVRDGKGGVDADDRRVTVDGSKGPFSVLQPNTFMTLNSTRNQVIQWNKACTDLAPVSCFNVDIYYSVDGGQSFVMLLAGTPNDGTAVVDFAAAGLSDNNNVRLKIACSDNVFFDLADADIALSSTGGEVLTASAISERCGTEVDYGASIGADSEPNDSVDQAQLVDLPFNVAGSAHDTIDLYDMFAFDSSGGVYVISLSDYANNDLDLYLVKVDGIALDVQAESTSGSSVTESIRIGLPAGERFYVIVDAYDTAGQVSSYQLSISREPSSGGGGGSPGWLLLAALSWWLWFARRRFSRPAGTVSA